MKHLLVETSFPQLANDISKIQNHIEISGELPEAKSIKPPLLSRRQHVVRLVPDASRPTQRCCEAHRLDSL
jgi:hypothetical protein